jgi:hypothetical protein
MNDRIYNLSLQADQYAHSICDRDEHADWYQTRDQKFAELIVRECIDIASQEDFDVMMKEGYPCSQTAKKIKEHFGVDE